MSEFVSNDGSFGDMADAPAEVKSVVESKGFKSVSDMAKSYTEIETYKGTVSSELATLKDPNRMALPETLTDEMRGRIYTKLGKPESQDKYDFGETGQQIKPEALNGIREVAFKHNLSNESANAIVSTIMDMSAKEAAAIKELANTERESSKTAKIGEMGEEKFNIWWDNAASTAKKLGLTDVLESKGLGNDLELMSALANASSLFSEDIIPKTPGALSESKQEKINRLQKDPAFMNNMHPNHTKVHKEWLDAHKIAG